MSYPRVSKMTSTGPLVVRKEQAGFFKARNSEPSYNQLRRRRFKQKARMTVPEPGRCFDNRAVLKRIAARFPGSLRRIARSRARN
jgi:hypothetical protein